MAQWERVIAVYSYAPEFGSQDPHKIPVMAAHPNNPSSWRVGTEDHWVLLAAILAPGLVEA